MTNKILKIFGRRTEQENLTLPDFSQVQLWKLFDDRLLSFMIGNKEVELSILSMESEPGVCSRFLLSDETGRTIAELTLSESNYTWHARLLNDKYDKECAVIVDQFNQQKEDVKIYAKIRYEKEKKREEIKALQDQN